MEIGTVPKIVFVIGSLYIIYVALKSWGVVKTQSMNTEKWKPLAEQEISELKQLSLLK